MLDEVLLSREGQLCLSQRRLGRREVGLRRLQRILLVLWVKPGDDLARREHIAHVDGPLDHPSVEAKGEVDLVLGANLPCQRNGLAFKGALDGGCPDGSCSGRGWCGLVAARNGRREQGDR